MHTSPSGKVYIGQTCHKNLENRWSCGLRYKECNLFYKVIEKYGWDNIKHEILVEGLTKDEANQLEVKYIAEVKQKGISYNICDGGSEMTENDRKRISESLKGRFAGPNNPTYGTEGPILGKIKIHRGTTSIYVNSDELDTYLELGWQVGISESHRKSLSKSFTGRVWVKKDNQTAQIEPEKLDKYLANGWVRGRISTEKWCKPCTEEKKQKIGQSNSGSCYIHKDGVCKHISVEEMDKYLSKGWEKGQLKPSAEVFKQKMKGRIFVHKQDGTQKMIFEDRFSEYEKDGWSKGRFKKQKL